MPWTNDPIFETFEMCNHRIPGVWKYILPEDFVWIHLPEEKRAVCDNCPKVITNDYRADCRCCTYFPQIPNFMVGLAHKDPKSELRVKEFVETGGALPEGSQISPKQLFRSAREYTKERFGKSRLINCPFMDPENQMCGIYPYRNSVCATFFCEYDHGEVGVKYWETVQSFVGQIETAISQWAMDELGIDTSSYIQRLNSLSDRISEVSDASSGAWAEDIRKYLWGDWFGREIEFYEKCADLVIERRDELYDLVSRRPLFEAYGYETAVKNWIPEPYRDEIPPLPEKPSEPVMVDVLWYKLELATRNLWALPYNEGTVTLNSQTTITVNQKGDALSRFYKDKPHILTRKKGPENPREIRLFVSREEKAVLELFKTKRVLGEQLLDMPELKATRNPKDFLAECMRRDILVVSK
jgi:Fe-S-cluster containining protein